MARYHFERALRLGGAKGKDYSRGLHEVPEDHEKDPAFLKYVGLGKISEPTPQEVKSAMSHKDKAEALLKKLTGKGVPVAAPVSVDPAAVVEEKPVAKKKSGKK